MAPTIATSASSATLSSSSPSTASFLSSEEILSTASSTDADDILTSTEFPSVSPDDFPYDNSNNSTLPTNSLLNINGTAGVITNYTTISRDDVDLGGIAVGGLDDIAMISSAEVMDGGGSDDFYRPHHRLLSPMQHVSTFPSNTTVKDGGSENSNFMFLLEDLGEYFYNFNSTSNSDSGNSGYYFGGITSTGFPNTTDFTYGIQNCSNVTCIDPIAGWYFCLFCLLF